MANVEAPVAEHVDEDPLGRPANEEATQAADSEAGERVVPALSRRGRITVALLTVATLALIALDLVFWLQVQGNSDQDSQRQEAMAVAKQQAITLISVNPKNVEQNMRQLLENSTGEFRKQFEAAAPTFEKVIREGAVDSKASVAEAGVISASDSRVRVLVAVNSSVHNAKTDKGEPRRYRLRVDVQKEADRWLVSSMMFVP